MRITLGKAVFSILIVAALGFGIFTFAPHANSQSYDKGEVVKLYSGNNLVGTWNAVSKGHMDGNTYVFNVGSTSSPIEVRICGTYSVERMP